MFRNNRSGIPKGDDFGTDFGRHPLTYNLMGRSSRLRHSLPLIFTIRPYSSYVLYTSTSYRIFLSQTPLLPQLFWQGRAKGIHPTGSLSPSPSTIFGSKSFHISDHPFSLVSRFTFSA